MAAITDPARELGEIAKRLTVGTSAKGAQFLAEQFGVGAWSTPFYRILACVLERADLVAAIVRRSRMDDDHKEDAIAHLEGFKSAFHGGSLINPWNNGSYGLSLLQQHGQPVQFLSSEVRPVVNFPRLTEDEVNEFLGLIDAYCVELREAHETPDFVRQAILDGLAGLRFQLEYMGWMGAGYTLAAFRHVMMVYEAVQRDQAEDAFNADQALRGLGNILVRFKETVEKAQSWADAGGTVLKAWQLGSSVATPLLLAHMAGGG